MNVATHMLLDVLQRDVEAVVLISNDSDFKLPVLEAKKRVPVGLVNPGKGYPALPGDAKDGVGGHWWRSLTAEEYRTHQLPETVGRTTRPVDW